MRSVGRRVLTEQPLLCALPLPRNPMQSYMYDNRDISDDDEQNDAAVDVLPSTTAASSVGASPTPASASVSAPASAPAHAPTSTIAGMPEDTASSNSGSAEDVSATSTGMTEDTASSDSDSAEDMSVYGMAEDTASSDSDSAGSISASTTGVAEDTASSDSDSAEDLKSDTRRTSVSTTIDATAVPPPARLGDSLSSLLFSTGGRIGETSSALRRAMINNNDDQNVPLLVPRNRANELAAKLESLLRYLDGDAAAALGATEASSQHTAPATTSLRMNRAGYWHRASDFAARIDGGHQTPAAADGRSDSMVDVSCTDESCPSDFQRNVDNNGNDINPPAATATTATKQITGGIKLFGSSGADTTLGYTESTDDDSSSGSGGGGRGSGSDSDSEGHDPPPREMLVHPSMSLKVGESLTGFLRSPDQQSAVFPSPVDGSLVSTTTKVVVAAAAAAAQSGLEEGPAHSTTTTRVLIAPDPRKVKKVLKLRADVLAEEMTTGSGDTGKLARVMRFMPFGRAGFRQRRARQQVKENLGERSISITARGVVVSKHVRGAGQGMRVCVFFFFVSQEIRAPSAEPTCSG